MSHWHDTMVDRPENDGAVYVTGWTISGLAVLGTVVLLISGGASASEDGKPATWVGILKIVLGLLLVLVAVRQWRGRPKGDAEPQLPGWMKSIDTFGTQTADKPVQFEPNQIKHIETETYAPTAQVAPTQEAR